MLRCFHNLCQQGLRSFDCPASLKADLATRLSARSDSVLSLNPAVRDWGKLTVKVTLCGRKFLSMLRQTDRRFDRPSYHRLAIDPKHESMTPNILRFISASMLPTAGMATAFAARDILGTLLNGAALYLYKPFSIGDNIEERVIVLIVSVDRNTSKVTPSFLAVSHRQTCFPAL